jgi:hypothetical protein
MTFTYVNPTTSDRDKVRFLIQDTDSANYHINDEEIAWLIAEWVDVYDAAATAADILAGRYAHKSNYHKSVGDLSMQENFADQVAHFQELARNLRLTRSRRYTVSWIANPAALQSTADRTVETYNTDAWMGQFDDPRGGSTGTRAQ